MQLEITDLRIMPNKHADKSNTLAYCITTFNNALVVSGIRIMEGKKGIYIVFPLHRNNDGTKHPVVYPASGEVRKGISDRILATYIVNHCVDEF